ncbi:putative esterase [Winogradskyella eximia]|jgi:Putative esterase|uniref:Putative esterase n=1 Tax=Winogradskyella eximia TaxID=262006 RepID=A0A3D9GPR0_9FLAO|nr:alpha/beta hydrolase [Winogradskyella eximia]RED38244.1 putative esterase [Winogradskyella eximia]
MKKLTYCIILICLSFSSYGQKFEVPDSILNGVESRQFKYTYTAKFNYKIVYPINYDSLTSYKVFIGLSGGNANEKIVNYCYYTLFDSKYFENYITILPLGPSGRPLSEMDSYEIDQLIADIKKNLKVTNDNWILAGTSMGGLAAYNFASARPELFEGIITFPGGLGTNKVSEQWENYKIVLAGGELDEADWISLNNSTKSELEGHVKSIEVFTIEGQGHIISPDYDIDKVYSKYFTTNK